MSICTLVDSERGLSDSVLGPDRSATYPNLFDFEI